MPDEPPPITTQWHFGPHMPAYPFNEKRQGLRGEVLLELQVDEHQRLAAWRIVRSTSESFTRSVLKTLSSKGRAPGAPAGVYSYSIVFNGKDESIDPSRPGTYWVSVEGFGR